MSVCLIDTTCLEANIHFPVDWLLLRDVSITLLKAIKLIRKEGLLNRMVDFPEELKGMKVLVVDDTPAMLTVTRLILERLGLRVFEAVSAQAAFESLEQNEPDLIVLDIMMPGVSGISACKLLKSRPESRDCIW